MDAYQVFAFIFLIFCGALLYWVGYRGGLIDGRAEHHVKHQPAIGATAAQERTA